MADFLQYPPYPTLLSPGVDFEASKSLGIKAIHALSLPGKVAPKSAAEYIAEIATHILETKGDNDK